MSGLVYLVGGGPGDPGLITLRAVECLQQAQVVVHDRLVNTSFLAYAPQAEWIDVGKRPDHHPIPQEEINAILVREAQLGKIVVRLKGGDPFVFGRGGEEAMALLEAGIPFDVVPGVTSAIAGPAYAGIPVTHRNVACSAVFITGHRADCGEDPTDGWRRAAQGADTLVFLMGVSNLPSIVRSAMEAGRPASTPVAVIERASLPTQRTVVATLADIVERAQEVRPPALIVIGEVAALRDQLRWFDLPDRRPLAGRRILNTRPLVFLHGCRDDVHQPKAFTAVTGSRDAFSRAVRSLGGEAVSLPVKRLLPLEDPRPLDAAIANLARSAGEYDWVIFTSANAVDFFWQRLCALGYDARVFGGYRLAAVGPATASALQPYGLRADFVPTHFTGEALAAELEFQPGQRALLPRSEIAPQGWEQVLEARGLRVEAVPAYRVLPAAPEESALEALLAGKLDAAAFFSPSALQGLAEMLLEKRLADLLSPLVVACIGPSTARAARTLGVRVDLAPEEHTAENMAAALGQHFLAAARQTGEQVG